MEGLGKKMDRIMEVLRVGFEKMAEKIEQGVDETHEYQKMEMFRRKKEAMKRVLEKSVGRSAEPEEPKELAGLVVVNQIGEIGDKMNVE